MSGDPFCRCTHTALSPDGDIYVSDGYWNARVHKYSPDGELLFSWGRPGTDPGEFNLPHNITCDADGWVYVADRENMRIQVFDGNGRFETEWHGVHRPSGLFTAPDSLCYVGEAGPVYDFNREAPNLGPRVSIWTGRGELVSRLQLNPSAGTDPGQFLSPHGIAVDSRGDIYVGEVAATSWPLRFPGRERPANVRALHKLARVAGLRTAERGGTEDRHPTPRHGNRTGTRKKKRTGTPRQAQRTRARGHRSSGARAPHRAAAVGGRHQSAHRSIEIDVRMTGLGPAGQRGVELAGALLRQHINTIFGLERR